MPPKAATEIDRLVGSRVRQRRMQVGMSQERLALALGLSLPQVQKYETGTNRIGASRLHQIARILEMPISFFFGEALTLRGAEVPDPSLFADRATIELALAFKGISSPEVRRSLLDLARALAHQDASSRADPANDG